MNVLNEQVKSFSSSGILPISQSNVYGLSISHVSDLPLTGSGESYFNCGTFFTVGCLNVEKHKNTNLDGVNMDGKVLLRRRKVSCHRAICPTCWGDWANRESKRAVYRLNQYRIRDSKNTYKKPIHVVVSVPFSDYDLSVQEMRRKAYRSLNRVHFLGGMMIYHPKRYNRFKGWYFSPHFHVVGYGWLTDVRKNYIYSGYIVKNVGIRKTVHGTLYYQLSHCGISKDVHTVTWFGRLSYSKLKIKYPVEEKEVCPLCGGQLRTLIWVGSGSCNLLDVEGITFFDDPQNWIVKPKLKREYTV
jgi:hypothetical protein